MNKIIKQMTLSGVLMAMAIIVGVFVQFPLFGGNVYLIGIVTFLIPLVLRIDFALITTVAAVAIADVVTGYGHYAWISILAYGATTIILWTFSKLKLKFAYMIGVVFSAIALIAIYFLLEWNTFGLAFATKDLLSTSLEMLIVFITTGILFRPLKMITKLLV